MRIMSVSIMLPIGGQMERSVANPFGVRACGYGSVSGVLASRVWIVSYMVSYALGSANRTSGKSGHIRTSSTTQDDRNR